MRSLERSALARFKPGERPSLTSPRPWTGTFRHACSAHTTCGSDCRISPRGIFHRRVSLHKLHTRAGTCPTDVLCVLTSGTSISSSTHDRRLSSLRSGCKLFSSGRDQHCSRDDGHRDQRPDLLINPCDPMSRPQTNSVVYLSLLICRDVNPSNCIRSPH